jgi:hypothetical protein
MTFDIGSFKKELYNEFESVLTSQEIDTLLEVDEGYNKDNPISSGKNLSITRIAFLGKKITGDEQGYSNDIINYEQGISTGINIWIADNLKGKSSILKIVQFALTGKCSLKQNIKKWISQIILCFKIGPKEYTVHLDNTAARLRAALYNNSLGTLDEIKANTIEPLINAKSQIQFESEIQDFFFKQFSYYSLKWTQKSPVKDSSDLLEASASWSTYFKSIFLESKDSGSLMYGDQGKKIFQMLLGLKLTYPINELSIKKDRISEQKGKARIISESESEAISREKARLEDRFSVVAGRIIEIDTNAGEVLNISDLYNEHAEIIKSIDNRLESDLKNEHEIESLNREVSSIQIKQSNNESEIQRLSREYDKNEKKIIDLKEYLAIGMFFSNLDIKHCPSCNHKVSEGAQLSMAEGHTCALCHEKIDDSEIEQDQSFYEAKIENLIKINLRMSQEIQILSTQNQGFNEEYQNISTRIAEFKNLSGDKVDVLELNRKLKEVETKINSYKERIRPINTEREELSREKTVIEYKLSEIANGKQDLIEEVDYESQIELLKNAIAKLNWYRYDLSKNVLKRLKDLMLIEIHSFGLTSITDIKISEFLDIKYRQDGEYISFEDIAEGEQLRAKIAFYLSLIQLDVEYNFGRHTRLLIIDSPGKEEGDDKYLSGLGLVLKSVQERFGDKIQILIGTAQRQLEGIVEMEYVTPPDAFIF